MNIYQHVSFPTLSRFVMKCHCGSCFVALLILYCYVTNVYTKWDTGSLAWWLVRQVTRPTVSTRAVSSDVSYAIAFTFGCDFLEQ